ncbi:seminal plasma protein HSP-1-like [Montipora foliosa]|uniref:seminal plasma protein HSP-1-like n=1 Tax=Montipora foliosa TaxID=591990 RepID=UPI0035F1C1A4
MNRAGLLRNRWTDPGFRCPVLRCLCIRVATCVQETKDGQCCSFPFVYNGVTYHSCTRVGSIIFRLWCALTPVYHHREWGYCATCVQETTDGQCCSFPFVYNGVTYHSCTRVGSIIFRLWCALTPVYHHREWGYCGRN